MYARCPESTGQGEPVYRSVGFESLGHGQTWWLSRGPAPSLGWRHCAGDRRLRPRRLGCAGAVAGELAASIAGDTGAVRLAILTDHGELIEWMLNRAPALARQRFPPHGGTLLHLAVERAIRTCRLALAHGVDPAAVDRSFGATPAAGLSILAGTTWRPCFPTPPTNLRLCPRRRQTPRILRRFGSLSSAPARPASTPPASF